MRLLIFLVIIYFAGKVLKRVLKNFVMFKNSTSQKTVFSNSDSKIDDVMVKDPYCGVYFPKRNGIHIKIDGKDLYFCSMECKNEYISSL